MTVGALNQQVGRLIALAQTQGPHDVITMAAYFVGTVMRLVLMPLTLVAPLTTAGLGILAAVSFGLLLTPLNLVWQVFLALILSTSRVWLSTPALRPFLFPLVVIPVLASEYVAFTPDMGEKYQKLIKLGLCDCWPYSQLLWDVATQQEKLGEDI